ncbi:40-residue YVTN family beta-propeller repeat-containing protein [Granulicella pectinivorans]|uniref:40-residue YVTN family beta-propeller repeat-containing protein n=1 Tax=Granulicella pectinivorans TaxID=474950 RepID=A0A1I6LUT1_9BACT|nr:YncE family protein [Granulicella pectinivorans]SFS07223.1 40-residue YVTN family beta-propeller repeat-containing protein [Granulicella pectinivorans]
MPRALLRHAAAVLFAASVAYGQAPASSGLIQVDGIAASVSGKIYAVNTSHDSVSIVDATGHVESVATGARPIAVAVNNRTGRVYVVNSGGHSVTILDAENHVVATVPTAGRSYAIALDEATNKVYVTNTFSDKLTVIDGDTHAVTNIKAGSADGVIVDPDHQRLYMLGYESDTFRVMNLATSKLTNEPTHAHHQWGFVRGGGMLYVAHVQDADIGAIDLASYAVVNVPTGHMPCALALNVDGHQIYSANYGDGTVTIVDTATRKAVATVAVGGKPQAIAYEPTTHTIYVADAHSGMVTLIDARTHRMRKRVPGGDRPYALAVNPVTHQVYAADMGGTPFTELR